ncbi:MAG: phage terminase large subunit [Flavobacteriales bacterium]|nr:phage terminase large subunit [Flavobacteriales bacterium]
MEAIGMNPSLLQPGKQTLFAKSNADITIMGGAAGGGKSYALLIIMLRHIVHPSFRGCIIRKKRTDISKSGGLFDHACKLYKPFGVKPNWHDLKMKFPSGAEIQFISLMVKKDVDEFLSFNYDCIGYDEIQLAKDESWLWNIQSRLRSTIPGFKPYLLGTCNPYPNWLAKLLGWWINEQGYADDEKCNVKRWMLRIDEANHWFSTREAAVKFKMENHPELKVLPTSVNFIPAKVTDNQILVKNDPHYISRLDSQNLIQRERLLHGNWHIVEQGELFDVEHFQKFITPPHDFDYKIITVDTAIETGEANDYTVMQCWGRWQNKIYLIDQFRGRVNLDIQTATLIALFNSFKPQSVYVEKAMTGSALITNCRRSCGMPVLPIMSTRASPGAAKQNRGKYLRVNNTMGYIESGYVYLCETADYYKPLIQELTMFSYDMSASVHDDQVDALTYAIQILLVERHGEVKASFSAPKEAFVTSSPSPFRGAFSGSSR